MFLVNEEQSQPVYTPVIPLLSMCGLSPLFCRKQPRERSLKNIEDYLYSIRITCCADLNISEKSIDSVLLELFSFYKENNELTLDSTFL